jgi:hypothetical protein
MTFMLGRGGTITTIFMYSIYESEATAATTGPDLALLF